MSLLWKPFGTKEDNPFNWTCGGRRTIAHRKPIASGGSGEVHEMVFKKNKEVFARKLIRLAGNASDQDIRNEVNVISFIQESGGHENIIRILDHGWLQRSVNVYFIDMELCDFTLDDYVHTMDSNESSFDIDQRNTYALVSKNCSLPEKWLNTWTIGSHIARGLEFMHIRNRVHRDLKPGNILYCRRDNFWKLTDFGITSEATSKRAITTHYSRGTQGYRAPELLSDDPGFTKKVDIWALGCILYELVTGRKAFPTDHAVFRRLESQSKLNVPTSVLPKAFTSHFDECIQEMLENNAQLRPTVSVLRGLFESYCLILYPSVPENSDDVESIPSYDTWKRWINEDIQDYQCILTDAINWYELNRGTESILRLLEEWLKRWHETMGNWTVAIEMCEKIVDKSPSEERLWRRLRKERNEWNDRLINAAKRNQVDAVQRLLDAKVDITAKDLSQKTALHSAAGKGHKDVVALLLGHMDEADVAAKSDSGWTALHYAAVNWHEDVVTLLLGHAAKDVLRQTALHLAAQYGHADVVALLLDKMDRADVATKDDEGETALHLAAQHGHADVVALLLGHMDEADVAAKDFLSQTALHGAAWNGHADVVALLLDKMDRADVAPKDDEGETALHLAAENGHADVVALLLGHMDGADVAAKDFLSRTALHGAAIYGHADVVALLLDEMDRADVAARDFLSQTALHGAAENGHADVIALLEKWGRDQQDH